MKYWIIILALGCLSNALAEPGGEADVKGEATEAFRLEAVGKYLTAEADAISLYVPGLCCKSCAIGVRKKLAKLSFIDKTRFNKGVELDAKAQVATVAIQPGVWPDTKEFSSAISDAGYELVRVYSMAKGKLLVEHVAQPAPDSK